MSELQTEHEENRKSFLRSELFSWLKIILIAVILAVLAQRFLIINANIPTGSMMDTIQVGDRVIASRLSYLWNDPERGDIIIFPSPDDKTLYVKRTIGLPGERVEIIEGKVYINGSETPLDEPYLKDAPSGNYGPYEVPEDCYLMLGDNRNDSWDARFWTNTYLHRDDILGKVIFRYYPKPSLIK